MKKNCDGMSDIRKLEKRDLPPITAEVRIHCPDCVRLEFKVFVAKYDFKNQWGALLYLIKHVHEEELAKTGTRVVTAER
jgi:hypothetical protein